MVWTPRGRRQQLLKFIQARVGQAGLVYVRTRRDSENLAQWLSQLGYATSGYHAGLSPDERRSIEADWLGGAMPFVVCTSAFGMGINKPDVRWVVHFHAPLLLSEYVQEIGRAGRDGKQSIALMLISEPTGWLDPQDKQRRQFFEDKLRSQHQTAQQLAKKLPVRGEVSAVARQFPDGAIALALLHSAGQLDWQGPFDYVIHQSARLQFPAQLHASQQMAQYLTTRQCRWQFLLSAFGFSKEAANLGCGHCDRCNEESWGRKS